MALNNNNMPNFNNMNLNQNAYNAYQNMFNNNPTFGMFNQMQLNQLLMNYVQNNPNLFFNISASLLDKVDKILSIASIVLL